MAYIPRDANWYLAELVEEIQIEDEPQNVVHVNFILIQADSPEEALRKANQLGLDSEVSYETTKGKQVTATFRGLRDLNVIHDELEHGAELAYEEKMGLTKQEVEQLVRPEKELGVFQPIVAKQGPNYASKEVMGEANRRIAGSQRVK